MPAPGTVCSLQLLSALWVYLARAGSSSLSLKHHEVQRKESKKPAVAPKPRSPGRLAWPGSQAEIAEDELEIEL
ncbi:hypothetical protein AB1E18_016046 [Capra hircus]